MKRLVSLLTGLSIIVMLVAVIATPIAAFAQDGHGEDAEDSEAEHSDDLAPLRGAAVYAEFCQACHGPQGESIGTGAAFPAIEFDADSAHAVIADGLDSDEADASAMPGYGKVLNDVQIADVIAYMETWESGDTP
ncbi:MAG: c-type cytochrome, partial [Anaerolineae bacterium]|nr:c-type cytochrome [Anaerolineae bacterium]